jgi:hypothetical protein
LNNVDDKCGGSIKKDLSKREGVEEIKAPIIRAALH